MRINEIKSFRSWVSGTNLDSNWKVLDKKGIFESKKVSRGFQIFLAHSRLRRRIPDTASVFWLFPLKYYWIKEYVFFSQLINFNWQFSKLFVTFVESAWIWQCFFSGSESSSFILTAALIGFRASYDECNENKLLDRLKITTKFSLYKRLT